MTNEQRQYIAEAAALIHAQERRAQSVVVYLIVDAFCVVGLGIVILELLVRP